MKKLILAVLLSIPVLPSISAAINGQSATCRRENLPISGGFTGVFKVIEAEHPHRGKFNAYVVELDEPFCVITDENAAEIETYVTQIVQINPFELSDEEKEILNKPGTPVYMEGSFYLRLTAWHVERVIFQPTSWSEFSDDED